MTDIQPVLNPRASLSARQGYTLTEVLIYFPIFATLSIALISIVIVCTNTISEHRVMTELDERNRVALHRIAEEIRPALRSTVLTTADDVEFVLPSSFDGSNIIPGDTIRYEFRTSNSVGQLVRKNVTTSNETVICENADVQASGFAFSGTAISITVVNTADLPYSNSSHTVSNSLTVRLRN